MDSSAPSAQTYKRKIPCRFHSQGHCRFGDSCKFSHAATQPLAGKDADSASSDPPPNLRDPSDAGPRPKRGETPCRAWKAGTCTRGSKCWFNHDIDKQRPESHKPLKQKVPAITTSAANAESPSLAFNLSVQAECIRAQEIEAAAAARQRADAIAREEATKTITQVVSGSIVTYSAGLDVPTLITGFETCTLRIGNLPLDVKEDDFRAFLGSQGLDARHFHFVIKRKAERTLEAHIVTDNTNGAALALGLDGVEFHEETLVVETCATNSLDGMNAAGGQNAEILTMSWRAPSARYIAEYPDIATANSKVRELDRSVYGRRRLKVEMNTQPRGRFVPNLPQNAIKISNLPPTITEEEVREFVGSLIVKRLPINLYSASQVSMLVRCDVEQAVPGGLKEFEDPLDACSLDGVVSARARFSSWDEAHTAYTFLSNKRYFNQPVWLRLPDPMYFTLMIPAEQYKAQKAQWDSLSNSIKDKKACTLTVRDSGNSVRIQLSGSVKEATGALKVRVENLARGDKVEGWHRTLGIPRNAFASRVYSETGAYLRADWKRQSLKVYGGPRAIDQAREMIRSELDRLASLDYTVTLARNSVGFFVREGIQQLKETLGENNVRFATSSRKITVSGGEEARHALDRLISVSHNSIFSRSNASQGAQTCPICYDDVSSPHRLGCGHTYCVACLRHFISSALESDQLPLTCLGDEARCGVPIAIPTIQQFLPPTSFNRLLEAAFDVYIAKHPEVFKHCKTPDCPQIYRAVGTRAAPRMLHCPSCFAAVCNGCHEDAHEGLSCAESRVRRDPAEQERLNDTWITSQNGRVKKCPQCSIMIEKLEGCNHMTCRCGAHICWRCMGIFTADTIYPHMHTAHGTIHGDAPAVQQPVAYIGPPVDVEEQREILRQLEARRAVRQPVQQYNVFDVNPVDRMRERLREEEERVREANRWRVAQLQRERVEREQRLMRERLAREAEQRRREQERQQSGGWGCTIM